jgi:hypothetical protein
MARDLTDTQLVLLGVSGPETLLIPLESEPEPPRISDSGSGLRVRPESPGRRRCAIYTRVSTDHGLEQGFDSLDALCPREQRRSVLTHMLRHHARRKRWRSDG